MKLVRGGGANADLYLRDRKSLVIDYVAGTVVTGG